jgi:hypothetical protein
LLQITGLVCTLKCPTGIYETNIAAEEKLQTDVFDAKSST